MFAPRYWPPRYFPSRYFAPVGGSVWLALTQARAGIERAGASRANYYIPNTVATINGTPASSSILFQSLRIAFALNDEPDTCSFTLKPGATIPTAGQQILIGLGASTNPIFGGQIARVTHERMQALPDAVTFIHVDGVDWTLLFDRQLITWSYRNMSGTAIAQHILTHYTANFTAGNIEAGLPTISVFELTNEVPSQAFRRLVALMGGGGFYIDPFRDVHLFGPAGETGPNAPTPPLALTNATPGEEAISHRYDVAQIRNRVIVEYRSSRIPIAVVAGAVSLPLDDASYFDSGGGLARVGQQQFTYSGRYVADKSLGSPPGLAVLGDVAIGGTHIITNGSFSSSGVWYSVAGQAVLGNRLGDDIELVNPSGYGSVTAPIADGDTITLLDQLHGIPSTALANGIPSGEEVFGRVEVDDAAAQADLALIEGGDGRHQFLITDGRLDDAGAAARAQAELEAFADPILTVDFETTDMNARVGARQVVNWAGVDPLSASLTITRAELTFRTMNAPPLRRCTASTVRLATLAEMTVTEQT